MPANRPGYEIRHAITAATLSRHRTRQAVLDNWRHFPGIPVKIIRVFATGNETLIVDGTWHAKE